MKTLVAVSLILTATCVAQNPTPAPKKDPFAGWGTSLDRRPNGQSAPAPPAFNPLPAAQPAVTPAAPKTGGPGGILLGSRNETALDISGGGHGLEIKDLKTLLAGYGAPNDDEGPHPDVEIYPGIPYLAPIERAEQVLLGGNPGMKSTTNVTCGGFPPGLVAVSYDGNWFNAYNRLYIVRDRANQAACLEFVAENKVLGPFAAPNKSYPGDWHVFDFVNARVKGRPGIPVSNWITDLRPTRRAIVINTTVGMPKGGEPRQTSSLYLPQPMIDLMLYYASK